MSENKSRPDWYLHKIYFADGSHIDIKSGEKDVEIAYLYHCIDKSIVPKKINDYYSNAWMEDEN